MTFVNKIISLDRNDEEFFNIYKLNVEKEAKNISIDVSKEEREFCEIDDKKLFLFYS